MRALILSGGGLYGPHVPPCILHFILPRMLGSSLWKLVEMDRIQHSLKQLQETHMHIKQQYEEEILRLRHKLESHPHLQASELEGRGPVSRCVSWVYSVPWPLILYIRLRSVYCVRFAEQSSRRTLSTFAVRASSTLRSHFRVHDIYDRRRHRLSYWNGACLIALGI